MYTTNKQLDFLVKMEISASSIYNITYYQIVSDTKYHKWCSGTNHLNKTLPQTKQDEIKLIHVTSLRMDACWDVLDRHKHEEVKEIDLPN